MNNDLDHDSVSCLWPRPLSVWQHMTAVVLSSDKPDTWLRELMLSHYNGGIAARGDTNVCFLCCDIEREREQKCVKTSIKQVTELSSCGLIRLNPSFALISYPFCLLHQCGEPFPLSLLTTALLSCLILPECPKLITWSPCALLLQHIHTYRNSKPKNLS